MDWWTGAPVPPEKVTSSIGMVTLARCYSAERLDHTSSSESLLVLLGGGICGLLVANMAAGLQTLPIYTKLPFMTQCMCQSLTP